MKRKVGPTHRLFCTSQRPRFYKLTPRHVCFAFWKLAYTISRHCDILNLSIMFDHCCHFSTDFENKRKQIEKSSSYGDITFERLQTFSERVQKLLEKEWNLCTLLYLRVPDLVSSSLLLFGLWFYGPRVVRFYHFGNSPYLGCQVHV